MFIDTFHFYLRRVNGIDNFEIAWRKADSKRPNQEQGQDHDSHYKPH